MAARKTVASSLGTAREEADGASSGVSLDILCRRAERLIESVRMTQNQVDQLYSRPDRLISEANATARSLIALRDEIDSKLELTRQAEKTCNARLGELQKSMPMVEAVCEGLIQRVIRARQLAETFDGQVQSSADRVQSLQAMTGQLESITETARYWREAFHEDLAAMERLLENSRAERKAWEAFLARIPRKSDAAQPPATPMKAPESGLSPRLRAKRICQVGDLIRNVRGETAPIAPPTVDRNQAPAPQALEPISTAK